MTELCKCLGLSTYEELTEAIQSMHGCHDAVWENDDKACVFYYTSDDLLALNHSLRMTDSEIECLGDYEKDDHLKQRQVADLISSAVKKTNLNQYAYAYRWENNEHIDINTLKVGSVIRYSSFVSSSVDAAFTFNNSKERCFTISKPVGSYIADYSKYYYEQELLIDKGAMFLVQDVSITANTIALKQIDNADLSEILANLTGGKVA